MIEHRLPDVMHMALSPRPSPSFYAYCKNWRWEWPGNKATSFKPSSQASYHTANNQNLEVGMAWERGY